MADVLTIRSLGGLAIQRNQKNLEGFASRKAELLLVYLACNLRPMPRELLADLLWDDRSQSQAMANLRVALSSLRHTVGDWVEITRHTAGMRPGAPIWLDVLELTDAVTFFRSQQATDRATDATMRLQAALKLVSGEFLEGVSVRDARGLEHWQLVQRQRCHNLALEGYESLGAWALATGDLELALATAERGLQWDPLSENGYRQQMEALARSGRRSEALALGERCRRMLWEELGLAPAAETLALLRAIQSGELQAALVVRDQERRDLPLPMTPLIGRDAELAGLNALLGDGARLITIVGAGGMGKTRLALEAARAYSAGAIFVDLTAVSAPEGIVYAIAAALPFAIDSSGSATPETQLLDRLRDEKRLLLLDNVEHLLAGAPLLHKIVNEGPGVTLLITSREPLQLAIEHLYPLHGLSHAHHHTTQTAEKEGAVALFLHHARRTAPAYTLRDDQLPALWQLMDLLAGQPLAIILASSWAPLLSLADIVAETRNNLDFLAASYADLPPRQWTMRAIFAASWGRLSAQEQTVFAALSVFRGGFTLEAAREIAQATPHQLLNLVQRTLLIPRDGGRFFIHELLRQFAAEELARSPQQEEAVRERHSIYYCRFLHHREAAIRGGQAEQTAQEMSTEFENARRAIAWASEVRRGALLVQTYALGFYCARADRSREAADIYRHIMDALAGCTSPVERRVRAMAMASYTRFAPMDAWQYNEEALNRALVTLEETAFLGEDVRFEQAFTLAILGGELAERTDEQAIRILERSISLFSELGCDAEIAWGYRTLGRYYLMVGNLPMAREFHARGLALQEKVGDAPLAHAARVSLARIEFILGQDEQAIEQMRKGLFYFETTARVNSVAMTHLELGRSLTEVGRFVQARKHFQAAQEYFGQWPGEPGQVNCQVSACWATLHRGEFEDAARQAAQLLDWLSDSQWYAKIAASTFFLAAATLAMGHIEEADSYVEDHVGAARASAVRQYLSDALAFSAVMALIRHDWDAARKHLVQALLLWLEMNPPLPSGMVLSTSALLLGFAGNVTRAIELYTLACRHPFTRNSLWFENIFEQRIMLLAETLPPEAIASARTRGAALHLQQTIDGLELELAKAVKA